MIVALLDIEQKDLLEGKKYNDDSYFYPIQDAYNNWIISTQEIEQNIYLEYEWIRQLSLIEYKPKEIVM
jgi:hypothetical protein